MAEPWPMLWTRRRPAATAFTCLLRLGRSQSNRARSHSAAAAIAAATITTARAALSGLLERAYHMLAVHTLATCIATHTSHAFFACAHALTLTGGQAGEDIDWSPVAKRSVDTRSKYLLQQIQACVRDRRAGEVSVGE